MVYCNSLLSHVLWYKKKIVATTVVYVLNTVSTGITPRMLAPCLMIWCKQRVLESEYEISELVDVAEQVCAKHDLRKTCWDIGDWSSKPRDIRAQQRV